MWLSSASTSSLMLPRLCECVRSRAPETATSIGNTRRMLGEATRPVCTRHSNTASAMTSRDRKSTRLNSSHRCISYAVFCLKKKKKKKKNKLEKKKKKKLQQKEKEQVKIQHDNIQRI